MVKSQHFSAKSPVFGIRHWQCFLIFWGTTLAYAMRVNLSLAIVAMTDKTTTGQDFTEYNWSEKVKSLLLSSFFWGYVITQIPGGFLANKFGGKYSILVGMTICSLLAILTPKCADIGGWKLVFALRVIQGLSQGVLCPTIHTLLSKWAPQEERGIMSTYCYTGIQFGTVVMLIASGFLASSMLGWPSIFYISGGLGIVWVLAWYVWGASTPSESKFITEAERAFINNSLLKGKSVSDIRKSLKVPWKSFVTSAPCLALAVTQCAWTWSFWMLLTEIPAYMKNILGFNIKVNALWTASPYFVMLVLTFVFAVLSRWIEKQKLLNLTQNRKLFNTLGTWLPAIALLCLGYIDTSVYHWAVGLLNIAIGFSAAITLGFWINSIDLSPNFAGVILGISSLLSNIMSILGPLTVGFIVTDEKDPFQWRIIFLIASGFNFIGNLLFLIFGSAEVQPWNEAESMKQQELKSIECKTSKVYESKQEELKCIKYEIIKDNEKFNK